MKKIITALIISAFVIVLGGTAVFAAGQYFTDADADGICDYRNTDCYAEYNYSNADNRTGICPCNNSCTPKYRHHANGNEDAGQPGHREHHGGFRFSSPVSCVCSPDHPLAHHDSLTKEQLSGNIIACSPRLISATLFSIQSRILSHLEPEQQYFTESIESAFTLAKAGLGYVLYPDIPHLREPGLRYVPVTGLPSLPFGVYYRYDNDHPVLKRFLSLCAEISAV